MFRRSDSKKKSSATQATQETLSATSTSTSTLAAPPRPPPPFMPVEDKEPTPDELFMGIYGGDLLLPDELTTPGALRSSAEAFEMDLISELSGGAGPDSARKQGPNPFVKARGDVAGGKMAQEKIDELVRRVNACWLVNLSNCEADNRFRADVAEMKRELAGVKEAVKEVRQMGRPLEECQAMSAYALLIAGLVLVSQLAFVAAKALF